MASRIRILTTFTLASMALTVLLSGCAVTRLPASLGEGVVNNDDLGTVREGLPTYLLILDGTIVNYPKNIGLKQTAANLNGSYASLFVDEPKRRKLMINKALRLAMEATCLHNKEACNLRDMKFEPFEALVASMDKKKDLEALYTLGSAWAGYVQENTDDWNAIAELAKVQKIIEQVVAIEPEYESGQALLYLGVLNSLVPASLGGKPEVAKDYFEQAITASDHRNLIVKVFYAKQYARLIFDQPLHDRLLQEVLDADPKEEGLTLQNVFAQEQAAVLLAESADYF